MWTSAGPRALLFKNVMAHTDDCYILGQFKAKDLHPLKCREVTDAELSCKEVEVPRLLSVAVAEGGF